MTRSNLPETHGYWREGSHGASLTDRWVIPGESNQVDVTEASPLDTTEIDGNTVHLSPQDWLDDRSHAPAWWVDRYATHLAEYDRLKAL